MSEVKRYTPDLAWSDTPAMGDYQYIYMAEKADGKFVRIEDYETLNARVAALETKINELEMRPDYPPDWVGSPAPTFRR